VVGEATVTEDGVRQALRLRPHVVVVDGATRERSPFEFARALTSADRRQRLLFVACHDDPSALAITDELAERMWDSGFHGIVDATTDGDQLARAVDQVRLGRRHLPPRPAIEARTPTPGEPAPLTRRERQVLTHIAQGYSTAETGQRLLLSPATVKHHLSAAHRKLGARSRVEAVMFAVTRGVIEVEAADVNARRQVTPPLRSA